MTNSQRPVGPGQTTLLDQFGRTRASFMALLHAHIDLFKAEIADIINLLKTMATLGAVALGVALVVGNLVYIGGFLFLGEWLFGSIGWGLAHGVLFGVGVIVALALGILGARAGGMVAAFVIALVVTLILALVLGLNLGNNAAANVAGQLGSPLNNVGLISAILGALILGLVLLIVLARVGGRGGAVAGLVLGIIFGAILGWLIGGAPWTWPPAVGFAITIGLLVWPILEFAICWPRLNIGERFARLTPRQSMDAVNETRAWLEEQWQTRLPTRGNK